MTFSIYESHQSQTPIWSEVQNVQVDARGRYTVLLGSANVGGIPPSVFVDKEARWLEIRAEGHPGQPRVILLSVPYAMKAADADTLGGYPSSHFATAADLSALVRIVQRSLADARSTAVPPESAIQVTSRQDVNSQITLYDDGRRFHNVRYCDRFAGIDAGAKIQACIADLPTTGGTADARAFEGAQTIAQDVFSGVTKPGILLVGAATFSVSATQHVPSNWTIRGLGKNVSVFISSFSGDVFRNTYPINGNNAAHVVLEDLQIVNTNGSNAGGCFTQVGGTYVHVHRIKTVGCKYGIIFDQTELGYITESDIEMPSPITGGAGIWLVNGDDHSPGGLGQFTNVITIRDNQINMGTGAVGIVDDGGNTHTIAGNNFNGGSTVQLRIAGLTNGVVSANQFEGGGNGGSTAPLVTAYTTYMGGDGTGQSNGLLITGNIITATVGTDYSIDASYIQSGSIMSNMLYGDTANIRTQNNTPVVIMGNGNGSAVGVPLTGATAGAAAQTVRDLTVGVRAASSSQHQQSRLGGSAAAESNGDLPRCTGTVSDSIASTEVRDK